MGDMGEIFNAMKEHSKDKKFNNYNRSIQILDERKIKFIQLSDTHLRVKNYDYWPSTGLFIELKTKKRGRGIFNLIKRLRLND